VQVFISDRNPSPPTTSQHKALKLLTATKTVTLLTHPKNKRRKKKLQRETVMDGCLPAFNLRDSLLLGFFHIPFYYLGEKPFSLG